MIKNGITFLITDGKHGDCNNLENSGYYFLSAKDIQNEQLSYALARQIEPSEFKEVHQRTNLEAGDICLVNTGATVGKLALVSDNPLTCKSTFQKSVAVIKVAKLEVSEVFVSLFLKSQVQNLRKKSGGSAINNLLLGDLKKKVIMLPPKNEQSLIIEKANELLAMCDLLKFELQESRTNQIHLADSITSSMVN